MYILGIESSCDDTCAAVVKDGRELLSNCVASSAAEQNLYGGVVPEIASRRHIEHISQVARAALDEAGTALDEIGGVAVTFAPGLIGAVLVGLNFAKGLALSAQKPLIPVHHLRGHIAALYLTHPELEPPFLCLVASGGHSHIVRVQDYTHFEVLGRTVDDAAGEAFDKVARTLGAGCTTTCLDGSRSAAHTLAVSSFSVSAPVGHTVMHWPQETQGESPKGASNAQPMCVEKPRSLAPITPTAWLALQAATQRRHRMHLLSSRTICGAESSMA